MWKPILLWLCLSSYCLAGPLGPKRNMPIIQRQEEELEKQSTAVANKNDVNKPEAANINIAASAAAASPPNMLMISTLTLPSNATSIRADITDGFSCANKSYGYYADVDNDCQIFHVCLPVTYADGRENTFRWSFICPEETIFSQDSFTCMRREDMTIECEESFKYYELNRNFGVTDEDENKQTQSSISEMQMESEDQESAMTSQVEHEKHFQPAIQQQLLSDEKSEKLNSHQAKPSPVMTQKEKPIKVQKPNRRKPSTSSLSSSNKKRPTNPIRKTAQPVTVQPMIATTVENIPADEETKPPRYTKRPATLSVNLKEKLQPVKQSELTPVRVDLYNQKRKRPSIFNKKDVTTIRPAEEVTPISEKVAAEDQTLSPAMQLLVQSESQYDQKPESTELNKTISNFPDLIASEASETSTVVLKPASSLPSTNAENIETKKISPPQPTEPDAITPSEIMKTQETPVVVPLEAIEEIPAVISEVEETNLNQKTIEDTSELSEQSPETHEDSPAIFQQNSEEVLIPVSYPSVEEMEHQKPENAPEIMSATPEIEHQDSMVEQMLSDNDMEANKQTMGGFKPVDPAMAAEAEALIANFLNTLMKSEKTNNEPFLPTNAGSQKDNLPEDQVDQETKVQATETAAHETNSSSETVAALEQQTPLMESTEPFPSMTMMMNNHPGEIFQIPVQIIQTPLEELTKTQSTDEHTATSDVETTGSQDPARPPSIDDIVELVKDKLDQVPGTEKEQETPNNASEITEESLKDDLIPEQHSEQLIVPIYQRVSSKPNDNMITAHSKDEKPLTSEEAIIKPVSSANLLETETNVDPGVPTNLEAQSNIDRTQRARSIKTAVKMDPRKRRFLFKSDAS